ncbi:MAG: hypothetical protein AAF958_17135 [Planctomycetota bacterium]
MRFRANSLIASSVIVSTLCISHAGCRSMGRWNPLARFGSPGTDKLADANPSIGFPTPPGQSATPQAIASIAGGTVGMPETSGMAAVDGVPSYAAAAANGFPPVPPKPSGMPGDASSFAGGQSGFAGAQPTMPAGFRKDIAAAESKPSSGYSLPADFGIDEAKTKASTGGGSVFNLPQEGLTAAKTTTESPPALGDKPPALNFAMPSGYQRGTTPSAGASTAGADVTYSMADLASTAGGNDAAGGNAAGIGNSPGSGGGFAFPDPAALSGIAPPSPSQGITSSLSAKTSLTSQPPTDKPSTGTASTNGAPAISGANEGVSVAMTSGTSDNNGSQPATRIGDASSVLPAASYNSKAGGTYAPGSTRTSGYPGASSSPQIQRNTFYR